MYLGLCLVFITLCSLNRGFWSIGEGKMRIKRVFWMAPLTLSLATAWGGVCFAQSGLAKAQEGEGAEVARATVNLSLIHI